MAIVLTVNVTALPVHFKTELVSIASRRQIRQTESEEEQRVKNRRTALKVTKYTVHNH